MNCTNHPEVEAQGMCAYCGKPFCKDCLVEVKGRMYCKNDLGNVLDEAKNSAAASQPTINITNTNDNANTNVNANVNAGFMGAPRKSKTVALILCLIGFLGFGGLHRMYVGKVGSGVVHFLTYGLCAVGTIIDLIAILSGGFRDSYGQPLV
ncbi:MAG: NINE protein [Clostridia bacterium]|nr:NINE protein [Clostridia bacterium]